MRIRGVAIILATAASGALAISAPSASASVPTIGQLAADTPSHTDFSVCELAIKQPVCGAIPAAVISTMSGLPADSASARQIAQSVGLIGGSAAFAYCHGDPVTGTGNIDKECTFASVLV
jgi:hypothetical protein